MARRSVLVGRAAESAGIAAALARCRAGSGGLVLISGEAGVGKSRLVEEALAGWRGRLLCGSAVTGSRSYEPLLEILRLLDEIDHRDVWHHLRPLLLGIRPADVEVDREILIDSIRKTFRFLADTGPPVVVLEDLHWADAATLDLLPTLAGMAEHHPVLVMATYRSDQLPRAHPLRRARTELRRAGRLTEFALRPLALSETKDLLSGLLGAPVSARLLAAVHSKADGLPFFVEELAATMLEARSLETVDGALDFAGDLVVALPDSVVDTVLARLADLRRDHREAVELAAVLGARVHLPSLARLVPAEDIDALLEAGLLVEQGKTDAEFRHALVQEALYGAIPWARRRGQHIRVAQSLLEHGRPPETVAEHWIAAHEYERARPLLLAAAERACALHAYRDAARLARRALAVWPEDVDPNSRIFTLERLAECAELCDEHAAAADAWAEVIRMRRAAGGSAVGTANSRLATARELLGDGPGAIAAREAAAAAFAATGAHGEAAAEGLALAEQLRSAAHNTRALEYAVAATRAAELAGRPDLQARALALQGALRAALGQGAQGVALAREGLALALTQQPDVAGEIHYELANALEYATDYAASAHAYEAAFELCREHGLTEMAQVCFACLSPVVRLMGDWDRSLSICTEVLDSEHTPLKLRMVAQEESGLINALRGDRRRARGPLRRSAAFGRDHEIFGIEVGAVWGLAVVAELDGDESALVRAVSALLERCAGKEEWHYALPALRWVSTVLGERGDDNRGAQCHRVLATAATRDSSPKVLSALAHAGGELSLASGDAAQAASQFGRAVELLHGVTAPYERALSQLRWGTALAAADRRQAAVDTVTTAYRGARQLGARPLAQGCVTRLVAMGEQVDRRLGRLAARSLEPAGLTRREKEVLRLLSGGGTNRQIAAELFVSTRTVDMHVRNVLGKLGCTSRVAAARRAAELGIVELAGSTPEVR